MPHACRCAACLDKRSKTKDAITASGFFTTEKIGAQRSLTPEGYLLCESVPIARTGTQDYAYFELPELDAKDGVIVVDRTDDVLFAPETMASFEGKGITIDHPDEFLGPANWRQLSCGTVRNVRRGTGDQSNLMLADLLITDQEAIRRVQSEGADALDQVSNGYDADYEQIAPGRARQVLIVGNHVALVKSARCGPVCSIGDSNEAIEAGFSTMKKKPEQSTLLEKLRKAFMTRDSDTFEKVAGEMTGDEDAGGGGGDDERHIHIHMPGGTAGAAGGTTGDDAANGGGGAGGDDPNAKVLAAIQTVADAVTALGARVEKIEKGGAQTGDDDPNEDPDADPGATTSVDLNAGPDKKTGKTGDSSKLADEFRETLSRAEIIAPGIRLPTFDAKADGKKTTDALCVLRKRALRAALDSDNEDLVRSVIGNANVSTATCDANAAFFNAAVALVKAKNSGGGGTQRQTNDGSNNPVDINEIHQKFWKTTK